METNKKTNLEIAIELIKGFIADEYGGELQPFDYEDLSKINIAHTTTEDGEHDIDVYVNLEDNSINKCINGKEVSINEYPNLKEFIEEELRYLNFDDLVYIDEGLFQEDEQNPMIILKTNKKVKDDIKRKFFIDKYNSKKIWEVAYLKGGYLLRQYLKNADGTYHLFNKGSRRSQKELTQLGILNFKEITNKTIQLEEKQNELQESSSFFMKKKRFTDEQIEIADNSSIVDYINTLGLEMKKTGQTLKIEGYGGLHIDPVRNRWNCFSERRGGGPIQLVMYLENKTWVESIKTILNKSYAEEIRPMEGRKKQEPATKDLTLPNKNNTYRHMIAYLIKTRKIDKKVVYKFMENKMLYEDKKRNCVFVGYDKEGVERYAGLRGTNTSRVFKGEVENSNKGYSFNLKGQTDKLYVFESPIELMSYLTINNKKQKSIEGHHLLSLAGTSDVALDRYLKDNPNIEEIILCLNNDKAGIKATNEMKEQYKDKFNIKIEYPILEDWNEDLIYRSNIQIEDNISNTEQFKDEWEMEL